MNPTVGTNPKQTANWPATRSSWRRLKLAFAGWLHAWADSIEISDHEQAMKHHHDH